MPRTASVTRSCNKCKGTGRVDSGGVSPWGEEIQVPCECLSFFETVDEQETIFDRDLRAIVAGWVSDPTVVATDTNSVKRIVAICVLIAVEMEISRNKRKGLKHE